MVYVLIAIAFVAMWIYGEYSNNRPLRLTAILVPTLVAGPLGHQVGLAFGHGRAYFICRTHTCALLDSAATALEKGNTSIVLERLKWLRMQNDGNVKRAGAFFYGDMEFATQVISKSVSDGHNESDKVHP
jgi:hypothetical protein